MGAVLFLCWAISTPGLAQEKFPSKPIELWIGYGAGGSTDLPARVISDSASKILGQPVVPINKPGGGSSVALSELKVANPDGYTLGVYSSGGVLSALLRQVSYHPVKDFEPILQYSVYQYGLVVRADSPWKTFKEFIAYAKANPGKIKYATAGAGTPQHLVMMQLGDMAKTKWTHIPFESGAKAITALLGGHVDAAPQTTEWKPQVDAGKLRLLATLMDQRMSQYPQVPTLKEEGYDLVAPSIIAIVGPKGLPKDRVKLLHDAFRKSLNEPALKTSLDQFAMSVVYRNTEDLGKFMWTLYDSAAEMIKQMKQ
jgi:tripartite-type tricarboxylate transporter receptor subunit TctC